MEDSKTKYIESSLAAFRAIKTFVFIKGIYPRNFNSGFWDEEDYKNPDLRLSMRNEFEQYLEMLASVHNNYVKVLYDTMPHIESEYNNLVIIHQRLFSAAKYVADNADFYMVHLVSFGCGLDALTTDEVREILECRGKLYTQIKIDEVTNLGAVKIRLRSLMAAIESGKEGTANE